MKYTKILNLKKPEQDDFYNVENDNDNMDKIDTEIAKKAICSKTCTTQINRGLWTIRKGSAAKSLTITQISPT